MSDYKEYFKDNEELMYKLEELHKKKTKLRDLIKKEGSDESFVVELCGLPRTGKSVSTEKVYSFFKNGGFKVEKATEPAYLIKSSLSFREIRDMSELEFNDKTLEVSRYSLNLSKQKNPDIILMDRGVIDNYFWYQMMYENSIIDFNTYLSKISDLDKDLYSIDQLFVMTADPKTVILRDYLNQIYLEKRNKTTLEKVIKLRDSYMNLLPMIESQKNNPNDILNLDTTNMNEIETSIFLADSIMDSMKRKLVLSNNEDN